MSGQKFMEIHTSWEYYLPFESPYNVRIILFHFLVSGAIGKVEKHWNSKMWSSFLNEGKVETELYRRVS